MDDYNTKKLHFIYRDELKHQSAIEQKVHAVTEADQKQPEIVLAKIILDFAKAENLHSFKDAYKRLRKTLKENPSLATNKEYQPFLLELILSFCRETFSGPVRDLKGLINELLESFLAYDLYEKEVKSVIFQLLIPYLLD